MNIEQLQQRYAKAELAVTDAVDKRRAIAQQIREYHLAEAEKYDVRDVDTTLPAPAAPPPKPNGKPPVNGRPKGRKVKAAGKSRGPKVPPTDAEEAVMKALAEQDGVTQREIAAASGLSYEQAGAALKRLLGSDCVSKEGKRPAKWYLQAKPNPTPDANHWEGGKLDEPPQLDGNINPEDLPVARVLNVMAFKLKALGKDSAAQPSGEIITAHSELWPDETGDDIDDTIEVAVHLGYLKETKNPHGLSLYRLTIGGHGEANNFKVPPFNQADPDSQAVAQANPVE